MRITGIQQRCCIPKNRISCKNPKNGHHHHVSVSYYNIVSCYHRFCRSQKCTSNTAKQYYPAKPHTPHTAQRTWPCPKKIDASMHLSRARHFPQFWQRSHWTCPLTLRFPRVDMEGANRAFAFSVHLSPTEQNRMGLIEGRRKTHDDRSGYCGWAQKIGLRKLDIAIRMSQCINRLFHTVRNRSSETKNGSGRRKPQIGKRKSEVGNRKPQGRNRKSDTVNRKP